VCIFYEKKIEKIILASKHENLALKQENAIVIHNHVRTLEALLRASTSHLKTYPHNQGGGVPANYDNFLDAKCVHFWVFQKTRFLRSFILKPPFF